MSSDPRYASISPFEMKMVQSVLDDAGYDANVLAEDQSLFNTAALLVMKLFLAGETSPSALTAQLERNFGKTIDNRAPYESPLPRDLAPKFYPVLSSLQRFWVAVFGAVAAGGGAKPFRLRSTASRRGLMD